jgi:hypothetical protein
MMAGSCVGPLFWGNRFNNLRMENTLKLEVEIVLLRREGHWPCSKVAEYVDVIGPVTPLMHQDP